MKKLDFTQGFTIIELMTIMIIIMILASLYVGVGVKARQKAMEVKAESMITAIELAIGMYRVDTGLNPGRDNQNATLVSDLTTDSGDTGWQGPYIEFKGKDLVSGVVVDPWGNGFNYLTPGAHNTASVDLWSIGKDETDGNSDDITNW